MNISKLLEFAFLYGDKNFDFHSLFMNNSKIDHSANVNEKDFSNKNLEKTLQHKLHPKQIIFCNEPELIFCEVEYSYKTNRNNKRQGTKVFVLNANTSLSTGFLNEMFEIWVKNFNKENPHREIANAKVIDYKLISGIEEFLAFNVNPKQVVFLSSLNFSFSKIEYSYVTQKNNKRQSTKVFVYVGGINPQRDMNLELNKWIAMFNASNPKTSLLNVKFLRSELLGYIKF